MAEEALSPKDAQRTALAVLSLPVLAALRFKPGERTLRAAEFAAEQCGGAAEASEWARFNYRTKGI